MWGTLLSTAQCRSLLRFIPTHVGNTVYGGVPSAASAVHPHACGEHPFQVVNSYRIFGSSPRMWGTPPRPEGVEKVDRFIPTHVGNTAMAGLSLTNLTVHPHACGEHTGPPDQVGAALGSSPRMWGTRARAGPRGPPGRFIPTHVGNTSEFPEMPGRSPVHPHACGEHEAHVCLD